MALYFAYSAYFVSLSFDVDLGYALMLVRLSALFLLLVRPMELFLALVLLGFCL